MVTVTIAMAATPIQVATLAGCTPVSVVEEREQEVSIGEQEQEWGSCSWPGGQGVGHTQEHCLSSQTLAVSSVQENLAVLAE